MSTAAPSPAVPSAAPPSPWASLRRPLFRNRLIASVVSNTGSWMQDTAGAWLMTILSTSPLLVSLMQTAASLPVLLLGLPAGATADIFDRRRLLLFWAWWMLAAAAVLTVLTLTGHIGPWTLLLLTFAISLGTAMSGPTWQAIVPELVPREELPNAVSLNSAGFNLARAIGPAAGGLLIAAFATVFLGAGVVFAINSASFLLVIYVLWVWKRTPLFKSELPAERLLGSIRAGLRYVRYSPYLRTILTRAFLQTFGVSAMWALLALTGKKMGHGALGYGILNGSIGLGAVAGAILLPRLRHVLALNKIVSLAAAIFAAVMLIMAYLPHLPVLIPTLILAGIAWTSTAASLNISVQTSVPHWVQARALGIYQMTFQGGMAIGSAIWGFVAEHPPGSIGPYGTPLALTAAAAFLLLTIPLALKFPLLPNENTDYSPGNLAARLNTADPHLAIDPRSAPEHDRGPVRVMIDFHIDPARAGEFIRAAYQLRLIRQRDGAIRWGLWAHPADPTRYTESFVVESWLDHLRQIERFTNADHAVRDAVFAFHTLPTPPQPTLTILARPQNP